MTIFIFPVITLIIFVTAVIIKKKMQYWILSYAAGFFTGKRSAGRGKPVDIMFCVVDHFEPGFRAKGAEQQKRRLKRWADDYPRLVDGHRDFDGQKPVHTWFFPPHDDANGNLESLADLCGKGFGEIEFHLHHDHIPPFPDSPDTLEKKIRNAVERYAGLGIFGAEKSSGRKMFGFVHGDWALDNSRGGRFCGVNNELRILSGCGCYADFTFPSICESQPRKINSIYYAEDDPDRPKSYNTGVDVEAGRKAGGDLMMIQGPLGLRPKKKGKKPFIAIEASSISGVDPPTPRRVDFWINTAVHVKGKPDWIFVKVHTHGALESNADVLLGDPMHRMYSYLEEKYNDGKDFRLHYVTAREMYNIIKAAENGEEGDPGRFRDHVIDKPAVLSGVLHK